MLTPTITLVEVLPWLPRQQICGLNTHLNARKRYAPRYPKGDHGMPQKPIPANKVRQLLHLSAAEDFNKCQSAERLGIARSSATKYIEAFKRSALTLTDIDNVRSAKLADLLFSRNRGPSQS